MSPFATFRCVEATLQKEKEVLEQEMQAASSQVRDRRRDLLWHTWLIRKHGLQVQSIEEHLSTASTSMKTRSEPYRLFARNALALYARDM